MRGGRDLVIGVIEIGARVIIIVNVLTKDPAVVYVVNIMIGIVVIFIRILGDGMGAISHFFLDFVTFADCFF